MVIISVILSMRNGKLSRFLRKVNQSMKLLNFLRLRKNLRNGTTGSAIMNNTMYSLPLFYMELQYVRLLSTLTRYIDSFTMRSSDGGICYGPGLIQGTSGKLSKKKFSVFLILYCAQFQPEIYIKSLIPKHATKEA